MFQRRLHHDQATWKTSISSVHIFIFLSVLSSFSMSLKADDRTNTELQNTNKEASLSFYISSKSQIFHSAGNCTPIFHLEFSHLKLHFAQSL